jgi:hypothetical protein
MSKFLLLKAELFILQVKNGSLWVVALDHLVRGGCHGIEGAACEPRVPQLLERPGLPCTAPSRTHDCKWDSGWVYSLSDSGPQHPLYVISFLLVIICYGRHWSSYCSLASSASPSISILHQEKKKKKKKI